MKKISTCLWFDHQADEATQFYHSVFQNSKIGKVSRYGKAGSEVSGQKEGSVLTVELQIEDLDILALNGGPMFKFTPSFSFFVKCSSEEEINQKWKQLSQGGQIRMGLDKYPWAEKYGWTSDKFGMEWQLMLVPNQETRKISPSMLFTDGLFGKGDEAIKFYTSLFPNSKIDAISHDESTKTVMHCAFTLNGQSFTLMEGPGKHGNTFTHAMSLVVNCENQDEIDFYWGKLSAGGSAEPCGWVKDKYGVSWQVVPTAMAELMSNPKTSEKVMQAMLKMTKLDIAKLTAAAHASS